MNSTIKEIIKKHKRIVRICIALTATILVLSALITSVILSLPPTPIAPITENHCTKTIINHIGNATVIGYSQTAFNTTYSTGTLTLITTISDNSTIRYIGCK